MGELSADPDPTVLVGGVPLSEVIADFGGSGLLTLVAGASRPVRRVAIFDPANPTMTLPGDLLLAVGVPLAGPAMPALIESGQSAGAAALVVRAVHGDGLGPAQSDGLGPVHGDGLGLAIEACADRGFPLVLADPSLTWERLFSLLQASIGSRALQVATDREGVVPLGDMFELAALLSRFVGGPTILEDAHFQVIGYSAYTGESDQGRQAAILSRHIPPEWLAYLRDIGVLEGLRFSDEVFRLNSGPFNARPRLITSVRHGEEMIGVIWVAEGDSALDEGAVERMREGRLMALPHFQRYRATDRVGDRRRSEALRDLIEGRGRPDGTAAALDLPATIQCCLVAVQEQRSAVGVGRRELLPALLEAYDRRSAVTSLDGILYGLAPISQPADLERVRKVAEGCVGRTDHHDTGLLVAVSSPRPIEEGLSGAREEVRALLSLAAKRRDGTRPSLLVGWEAEAEVLTTRAENLLHSDGRFRFSKVGSLGTHDEKHGTQLTRTLATYLLNGQSVSRTSAALRLHHTTTRYRLAQIARISGLRLHLPDECLAATLHLLATRELRAK